MKFSSYIEYVTEPAKIAALRPDHRDYLSELFKQGKLLAAGPFSDDSGALFIYEAGNLDDVLTMIADDPFAIGGVFASVVTKPWKLVFINAESMSQS